MGTIHKCVVCGEEFVLLYCPNNYSKARTLNTEATGEMALLLYHSMQHKNDPTDDRPPWCFPETKNVEGGFIYG